MRARIALALCVVLAGCAGVPTLTFTDASTGGQDAAIDAGGDVVEGGPNLDAGADVEQGLCADGAVPPDASLCCGNVPCVGCGIAADCNKCTQCSTSDLCCFKTGNGSSCQPLGSACPP